MAECTVAVQDIELIPGTRPFRTPPRRMHPRVKSAVDRVLNELLEAGIISRSVSDWAAALVPVVKKDSSVRICVDNRVSKRTVSVGGEPGHTSRLCCGAGVGPWPAHIKSSFPTMKIKGDHVLKMIKTMSLKRTMIPIVILQTLPSTLPSARR